MEIFCNTIEININIILHVNFKYVRIISIRLSSGVDHLHFGYLISQCECLFCLNWWCFESEKSSIGWMMSLRDVESKNCWNHLRPIKPFIILSTPDGRLPSLTRCKDKCMRAHTAFWKHEFKSISFFWKVSSIVLISSTKEVSKV